MVMMFLGLVTKFFQFNAISNIFIDCYNLLKLGLTNF